MFCMLLRKHLSGGRLVSIQQPPLWSEGPLTFQCTGELGDQVEAESGGRSHGPTTNIYLPDEPGGFLTACAGVGPGRLRQAPLPGPGLSGTRSQWKALPPGPSLRPRPWPLWRPPGADSELADRLLDTCARPLVPGGGPGLPGGLPTGGWRRTGAAAAQAWVTISRAIRPGAALPPDRARRPAGPTLFVPIFHGLDRYAWEELPPGFPLTGSHPAGPAGRAMRRAAQSVRRTVQNLRDRTRPENGYPGK